MPTASPSPAALTPDKQCPSMTEITPVGGAACVNSWRINNNASIAQTAAHFGISAKTVKVYWAKEITPERRALIKAKQSKHGLSESPEYQSWAKMHSRCRPNTPHARYYFDRGIRVCERWKEFVHFYSDMGPKPAPRMTLDRIDTNGIYEPGNCRWATMTDQARNKTNNRLLVAFGEAKTIAAWLEDPRCVVCKGTIRSRLRAGMDVEVALTTPARKYRKG